MKVSIIVPIYNGELYIDRCMNNLLNQELEDIEILLVNDGSTDRSLNLLNKYCHLKNVKVIHQENKGAAAARNKGVECATGEYIGFMDVDDEISHELYSSLFNLAKQKNYDIVCCGFFECNQDERIAYKYPLNGNEEICGEDIYEQYMDLMLQDKFLGYLPLWNKLFKRSFIIEENLKINQKMILGEDREFNCRAFLKAQKIACINKELYFYKKDNSNSVTRKYNKAQVYEYLVDRTDMFQFVISNIKDKNKIMNYNTIVNKKIFFKLIDYCILECKTNNSFPSMYRNVKEILSLKVINQCLKNNLEVSFFTSYLIKAIKKENYLLSFLYIYFRSHFIR